VAVPAGFTGGRIYVGKNYGQKPDQTEADASVEGDGILLFIEAKLYSSMSLKDDPKKDDPKKDNFKKHDQIAKKLRVGVKEAKRSGKKFYFIILDIAPKEALRRLAPRATLKSAEQKTREGFATKWKTAYWFARYKGFGGSVTPLKKIFDDMEGVDAEAVARNMGWLTWPDVFKAVLRAVIASRKG
jgi:hypothetical protein